MRKAISNWQSAISKFRPDKGAGMKEFRRLMVWQKAHALTLAIYRATADFSKEETYGIRGQMRRCSASIAANIAEGCGRTGNGDFHRFLNIAAGSLFELEYFVLLSRDLGFLCFEAYEALTQDAREVQRMLGSLLRKVENSRRHGAEGQERETAPTTNC
jgi:four helix bundle protein